MPSPILGQRSAAAPVPPDPNTLSALQWLRSDSVSLVGSDVDVMVDLTPNGLDVPTQSAGTRPLLVPGVLNDRAAVRSAGAARMIGPFGLVYPSLPDAPCSFMAVWAPTSGMLYHVGSAAGGFDGMSLALQAGSSVTTRYYENGSSFWTLGYVTALAPGVLYTVLLKRSVPPLAPGVSLRLYEQGATAVEGGTALATGHALTNCALFFDQAGAFGTPYVGDLFDWALFDYCLDPATDLPLLDAYVLATWGI